jgi:hypothetical protein
MRTPLQKLSLNLSLAIENLIEAHEHSDEITQNLEELKGTLHSKILETKISQIEKEIKPLLQNITLLYEQMKKII